jgi:single-stranded-DNA-specific exonuclease
LPSSSTPRTSRRQQEEAEIVAQAKKIVETDLEVGSAPSSSWRRRLAPRRHRHRASKLVDAFHRPAIVLSIDGDVAHGSCRSIPAFNMLAPGIVARADDEVRRPTSGMG